MATVSSVTFPSPQPAGSGKVKVKVNYTIDFAAAEFGKSHRITVQLMSQDLAGDNEGAKSPKVLHTFMFGLFAYKSHTPAGPLSDSVEATILQSKLNEDPGSTTIHPDINTTIQVPHQDEVFAKVTVSRIAEGVSSPPVTLFA